MSRNIPKPHTKHTQSTQTRSANPNAKAEQKTDDVAELSQQCAHQLEDEIRAVAYGKWQAAGCPSCDGIEFWLEAEREVYGAPPRTNSEQGQGLSERLRDTLVSQPG